MHVNLTSNWADDAIRLETEEPIRRTGWHHVAVTYNGSRMARRVHVYVDGKPRGEGRLDTLYRPFQKPVPSFTCRSDRRGLGPERRFRGDDRRSARLRAGARRIEVAALALERDGRVQIAPKADPRTAAPREQLRAATVFPRRMLRRRRSRRRD